MNQETHPTEALMTRIITECFPTSRYEKSLPYEIEVYGPGNTQLDDYTCEVWIPVKKNQDIL